MSAGEPLPAAVPNELASNKQPTETNQIAGGCRARTSVFLEFVSGEWLLTRIRWPNGGDVIFIRSLLVASEIYWFGLLLQNGLDSNRSWEFSALEIMDQVAKTLGSFATIFAAVYAALYARFSSQWTYLANVYNQIKAAESRAGHCEKAVAEWKAGFIEDAEDLHLAYKPLFASVVRLWGRDPQVKEQFESNARDGSGRLESLIQGVEAVWHNGSSRQ